MAAMSRYSPGPLRTIEIRLCHLNAPSSLCAIQVIDVNENAVLETVRTSAWLPPLPPFVGVTFKGPQVLVTELVSILNLLVYSTYL